MTLIILFMLYLCGSMMLGLPIAFSLLFGSVATALHMGGTATNPQIVATQ
ncbi:L-dehydroascorbate transporter large permease subunit, partial [Rhodoferax sp. 4810]|nr:L-dehydroascorbate transporter large permease subunit [Rhodoferax jenense]